MTEEFEAWVNREIDSRLDKLFAARIVGDDVSAAWQKLMLGTLTALRRLRRAHSSADGPRDDD